MLDHVDCGDAILKVTKPRTTLGGILGCIRQFSSVVSSAFGYPFRLLSSLCSHSFASMASLDLIDITSTDSDSDLREIDNYRESPDRDTASSTSDDLENWPSSSHPTGYNVLSCNDPYPSSKRPNVSDDTSLRPHKRLNSTDAVGSSDLEANGNNHHGVGLNNYASYGSSHKVHSSHQPIKSTTPAVRRPFASNLQMNDGVEIIGTSKGHEAHGISYPIATRVNTSSGKNSASDNLFWEIGNSSAVFEKKGSRMLPSSMRGLHPSTTPATRVNTSSGKNSASDNLFREIGNSSAALEKKGSRLLPPSMRGLHPSTTPFIGSNDPFFHTALGEEGSAGADEKLVLQAAMQDLGQSKAEANLPNGLLSVSLLRHQKIALAWMLKKESSGLCLGGILADDQGLGKTVSTIALIQMQKFVEEISKSKRPSNARTEALNLDDDDGGNGGCVQLDDANQMEESGDFSILPETGDTLKGFRSKRPSAGTLIVCPASVVRQWARELDEKVPQERKLRVLIYHGANRTKSALSLAKHDVVLTTYAIVTNEVPKQPLVEEDDEEQKGEERHGASSALYMEKKHKKHKKVKKGKREIDLSAFDNGGTLARVKWSRVVLDESQTIKNHRTQVARACCSLRAKRRWCLSGTPIQNSVDELFSYFRFLRYDPYDKFKIFSANIKGKISRDSVTGYQKLQVVLKNIMLRRTKGTLIEGRPIITLPPKRIQLRGVEFSSEERIFYNKLESDSKKQFKAYAAAGTVNQNYANILLMLLRLRQACDHPLLVKGFGPDPVGKVSCEMAKILPGDLLVNLWKKLENSLAICLVCRDPPENAVVTMCGHVFCYQCVSDHITGDDNICPVPDCKEQLGADNVFSKSTLTRCISEDIDSGSNVSLELDEKCIVLHSGYVSSKIKCCLEILKLHCISRSQSLELSRVVRNDGDASSSDDLQLNPDGRGSEKAIVFSQWTSMLDLVEISLQNSDINYRRLDGTMSIAARDKAVKDFNSDPKVDVMLMSLKAGNLGLNMVAASRVILLDLWWNPATEDQAIDRAHRIGQTRPVTVSRITIKNTVEDRILALQEEKRKMVASAFGEDQSGRRANRLTAEDLRFLFEG